MNELNFANKDIERILFTKEHLNEIISRLGKEITDYYKDSVKERKLILIGVLKGSFVFLSDLVRNIDLPLQLQFLQASSYGNGTESCGRVQINMEMDKKLVDGADVLFVEDILDSGRTLKKLTEYFASNGANSVKICAMLDKPARRVVDINLDFCGSEVEDEFIVGYGLDYNEVYRNLDYIGVLKKEIYNN